MNTMQLLLLGAIGASLVISFIMKMPSANRRAARKQLGATPWLDETSADGSQVKVTGIVRMREQGERFVSPLSETRCVVLQLRVYVRHGRDPRAKLVDDFKIMPFMIEDEGGKILVDAEHAILDMPPVKASQYQRPRKNQLLTDMGYDTANSEASEFQEILVEVGATVTLTGILKKEDPLRIVGTKEQPIAIRAERVSNQANEP